MRVQIAVIVLVLISFVTFGWSGLSYRNTPTQPTAVASHKLTSHGTVHYLTDGQWHGYVWLNVVSGAAFLAAFVLNWRYKPFQQ